MIESSRSSAAERRDEAALDTFTSKIAKSPLCTLSLMEEPAIRDFFVDILLHDAELASCVHVIAILALCWESGRLGLARENIAAIFFGRLPRRKNGILLHVVAASGSSAYLVELTLHIMALCAEANTTKGDTSFKQKVVPGDTLVFKLVLSEPIRRGIVQMHGEAYVGTKLVSEASLMAQIVKERN